MNFKNRLWNRSALAWANLLVADANLIMGLINFNRFSVINFFIAGLCFGFWFLENQLNYWYDSNMKLHKEFDIILAKLNTNKK